MEAVVNKETCIGCELCVDTCPEVFAMDGDKARARIGVIPAEAEATCREAAEICPVEAISIEE